MTTYTLFCAPSDQADVPMGDDYTSIEAACAALPEMMIEWDEQSGNDGDVQASDCSWYVWDNDARCTVKSL